MLIIFNYLLCLIILVLLISFTYLTLKIWLMRKKYQNLPGPKTKGIIEFYFGHYFTLNKYTKNDKIFSELFREWSEQYGSVFVYQFMTEMACVTTDAEAIKEIMIDRNFKKKDFVYQIIGNPFNQRLGGNGLATEVNHDQWKKRRPFFNQAFKKEILLENIKRFNSKSDLFFHKLKRHSYDNPEKSICLLNEFNRLALDVIADVAFDLDLNTIEDPDSKFNYHITNSLQAITLRFLDPFCMFKINKRKLINELKNSIRKLREECSDMINKKLTEINDDPFCTKNLFTVMLEYSKTDADFDFETFIDDFVTFFVAGQETTANALAFCFLELGKNEEILNKLKEEIDQVLGTKPEITSDDLAKLNYTNAVFKESLRKWPPVATISRDSHEEITINNHKIPKNTWFFIPPFLVGRNEKYFPKPDEFIPERFLKDDEFYLQNNISSYTYFPFSLGPRNCIGQNFALIEGKTILAKFIQNFDFKLDENQSFKIVEYTTIRPIDGVKVYLTPRF
nr:cytochrome p450 CYP3049E1 [Brachionus angularis]